MAGYSDEQVAELRHIYELLKPCRHQGMLAKHLQVAIATWDYTYIQSRHSRHKLNDACANGDFLGQSTFLGGVCTVNHVGCNQIHVHDCYGVMVVDAITQDR